MYYLVLCMLNRIFVQWPKTYISMNRYTIQELQNMRESENHVEFKRGENGNVSYNGKGNANPKDRRRCILGYVIALCNEGGGRIVIGMHDEYPHRVTGTSQAKNLLGQLESDIYRDTTIRPDVYDLIDDETGKRVLVIEVPGRPIGKVFKFEDVPLMRVGEELRPMSDAVYLKILQESEPDYSEKVCEELTLADLDEDAISKMKSHYANKWNKPEFEDLPTVQVLTDFKLMDKAGKLNYAALVLLGRSEVIKRFLPQNNVVVEYRLYHSMIEYTSRREFTEPLFLLVDDVWAYINQPASNPLQHYRDRMNIFDLPTFNEDVIREAVLNAICHRVMYIQSDVVIKQYPDEIVITNAGGFPVGVDVDNILRVNSMPRSKRISEVLQKTGLVEKSGQGVDKMFYHNLMEGKSLPDFSGTDNFQVSLRLSGIIENPAFLLFVNEIQKSRSPKEKLNVFDLYALYKLSKGESLRDTDDVTLQKLIHQGLINKTGNGYVLSSLYDEMKGRTKTSGETNGETNGVTELTERHIDILNLIGRYTTLSTEDLARRMAIPLRTMQREISFLRKNGYLGKQSKSNNSPWVILKQYRL